jgi:hypothetical protein
MQTGTTLWVLASSLNRRLSGNLDKIIAKLSCFKMCQMTEKLNDLCQVVKANVSVCRNKKGPGFFNWGF